MEKRRGEKKRREKMKKMKKREKRKKRKKKRREPPHSAVFPGKPSPPPSTLQAPPVSSARTDLKNRREEEGTSG